MFFTPAVVPVTFTANGEYASRTHWTTWAHSPGIHANSWNVAGALAMLVVSVVASVAPGLMLQPVAQLLRKMVSPVSTASGGSIALVGTEISCGDASATEDENSTARPSHFGIMERRGTTGIPNRQQDLSRSADRPAHACCHGAESA